MPDKFEIRQHKKSKTYYAVLRADNGEIIVQSKYYGSYEAVVDVIESIKQNSKTTEIDDITA